MSKQVKTLKRFQYEKSPGEVSNREVFILSVPSDAYFGIDLSEFDKDEKEFYLEQLKLLHSQVDQAIKELGLSHNYRMFLKRKVVDE